MSKQPTVRGQKLAERLMVRWLDAESAEVALANLDELFERDARHSLPYAQNRYWSAMAGLLLRQALSKLSKAFTGNNIDLFGPRLDEVDAMIEQCIHEHSDLSASMSAAKTLLATSKAQLRTKFDVPLASARSLLPEHADTSTYPSLLRAVTSLENLSNVYINALERSNELLTVCVEKSIERLNYIHDLILDASEKRDRVKDLLSERRACPDTCDTSITILNDHLRSLKRIFSDDRWGDDNSFEAHKRLQAAIMDACRQRATAGTERLG